MATCRSVGSDRRLADEQTEMRCQTRLNPSGTKGNETPWMDLVMVSWINGLWYEKKQSFRNCILSVVCVDFEGTSAPECATARSKSSEFVRTGNQTCVAAKEEHSPFQNVLTSTCVSDVSCKCVHRGYQFVSHVVVPPVKSKQGAGYSQMEIVALDYDQISRTCKQHSTTFETTQERQAMETTGSEMSSFIMTKLRGEKARAKSQSSTLGYVDIPTTHLAHANVLNNNLAKEDIAIYKDQ